MGIVNQRHNSTEMRSLFLHLAHLRSIRTFVETGTWLGATTDWASSVFRRVVTIEASPKYFDLAVRRFSQSPNVECLFGDSRRLLGQLEFAPRDPVLFWLDAHWSAGDTYGEESQCPLLEELEAAYRTTAEVYAVIDDARLFVSVPHCPLDPAHWPTYFDIAEAIRGWSPGAFLTVYADAILAVPESAKESVVEFVRSHPESGQQRAPKHRHFLSRLFRAG